MPGNSPQLQPVKKLCKRPGSCINARYICPQGSALRHTTTDKEGKRTYRSTPKDRGDRPSKSLCGANEKGQTVLTAHIWQEHLDIVEQLRKTGRGKELYAPRKQTIERVFADAKEKHAMRYTRRRGLTRVTRWVKLKFAPAHFILKPPSSLIEDGSSLTD